MTNQEEIQNAIEWIEGLRNGWNDEDNIKYCNMAIKTLEQTRWIPVTERLPEKEGWYLCTICKRGDKAKVVRLWCWHRHLAGDIWWESCGWKDWKTRGWKVNAWMPLPTVYEPQESENATNLCIQCTNERCVMQSGICRNNCDFFIPEESEEKA